MFVGLSFDGVNFRCGPRPAIYTAGFHKVTGSMVYLSLFVARWFAVNGIFRFFHYILTITSFALSDALGMKSYAQSFSFLEPLVSPRTHLPPCTENFVHDDIILFIAVLILQNAHVCGVYSALRCP